MTLTATIPALRTVVDTLPGLRVYTDPPESINEFPSAIVYSNTGEMNLLSGGFQHNYHELYVDIYHTVGRLAQSIDAAKAWPDLLFNAIVADNYATIYPVATNERASISYRTGPMPYNGVVHFGVRFTIRLKENVSS